MVCFALAARALRRQFAPVQSVSNNTTVFINTIMHPQLQLVTETDPNLTNLARAPKGVYKNISSNITVFLL